jgi:hypothetical protein
VLVSGRKIREDMLLLKIHHFNDIEKLLVQLSTLPLR